MSCDASPGKTAPRHVQPLNSAACARTWSTRGCHNRRLVAQVLACLLRSTLAWHGRCHVGKSLHEQGRREAVVTRRARVCWHAPRSRAASSPPLRTGGRSAIIRRHRRAPSLAHTEHTAPRRRCNARVA
eukprot:scaffold6501_cov323-Prasinococcus_capsulatus_cf.AAC.8